MRGRSLSLRRSPLAPLSLSFRRSLPHPRLRPRPASPEALNGPFPYLAGKEVHMDTASHACMSVRPLALTSHRWALSLSRFALHTGFSAGSPNACQPARLLFSESSPSLPSHAPVVLTSARRLRPPCDPSPLAFPASSSAVVVGCSRLLSLSCLPQLPPLPLSFCFFLLF